jgi:hypothetical protein
MAEYSAAKCVTNIQETGNVHFNVTCKYMRPKVKYLSAKSPEKEENKKEQSSVLLSRLTTCQLELRNRCFTVMFSSDMTYTISG